jgi:tetratricopeptide (TPR) repeat protein/class 3 adenylate cyclase
MVLMFTDIVDSVAMKRRIGDVAYLQLLERHRAIIETAVSSQPGGRIIEFTGDGFLVRFATPGEAVNAALHFQHALAAEPWGAEPIHIRTGIHSGTAMEIIGPGGRPNVSGLAVDVAARIMGLAEQAQVLMTRHAFDDARQYVRAHPVGSEAAASSAPALEWRAHGPYLFKGTDEPLEIYEVGTIGIAPLRPPQDSEKVRRAVAAGEEAVYDWRPAAGQALPRREGWLLDHKLGEGGFGEVWLAKQQKTGERRVFKFCFDAERLRSFQRELTLFRLLREALGDRKDIARIHDVSLDHAPFFLESEYSPGGDLYEWAAKQGGIGTLPLETRLDILRRVADAVSAAHSVGVLHKDLKPANILMESPEPIEPRPKLADFGIGILADRSRLESASFTVAGFTVGQLTMNDSSRSGTRLYAPPEMLAGRRTSGSEFTPVPFTAKGDVYALGVMLYQFVIGDLDRPMAVGWERNMEQAVPDLLLRKLLSSDIAGITEGDPALRVASAAEVSHRLSNIPKRREDLRRQEAAEAAERNRSRRRRRLVAIAAIAALLVLAIGGFWLWRDQQEESLYQSEVDQHRQQAKALVAEGMPNGPKELYQMRDRALKLAELIPPGVPEPPEMATERVELQTYLLRAVDRCAEAIELCALLVRGRDSGLIAEFVRDGDRNRAMKDIADARFAVARMSAAAGFFPLAEQVIRDTRTSDAEKDAARAWVAKRRSAVVDSHRARIAAVLDDVAKGLGRRDRPYGAPLLEDYVFELVGHRDLQTVEMLGDCLKQLAIKVGWKDGGTDNAASATDIRWTPEERDQITLCCRVLGRLAMGEYAVKALASFSAVVTDHALAIEVGLALGQTAHESAWVPLDSLKRRLGVNSSEYRAILPALRQLPTPPLGRAADAIAYNNRGLAREDKGDLEGAIADYSKAIDMDPKYAAAYNNRGLARAGTRDLDGAVSDYSKAIDMDPNYADAYNNRGLARGDKGDPEGELADLNKAIDLDSKHVLAHINRGVARGSRGDLDGAIADFGKALALDPKYASAYYNRGFARRKKDDLDGAVADFTRALELDPRYVGAYNDRGLAREVKGDLDGAIADYTRALELDPRDAGAYSNRGFARRSNGDLDGAIADFEQSLKLRPGHPQTARSLAAVRALSAAKVWLTKEATTPTDHLAKARANAAFARGEAAAARLATAVAECGMTLETWKGATLTAEQESELAATCSALGRAFYNHRNNRFADSYHWYTKALEHRAGLPSPVNEAYNAACAAALEGGRARPPEEKKPDGDITPTEWITRAFAMLTLAGELGYAEPAHASTDTDLIALRTDPRWPAVIDKFKANAAIAKPPAPPGNK